MRKGTHGGQVDEDASTCHARFVIRLKALGFQVNPMDSLRRQPLNYVHNWTSPTTIKRKSHHTCKHVLLPDFSWKKRWSQAQRHVVQPNDIRQGENRKMTSCSLYLNELLIQKCKFRHRVVASTLCLDKHSPKGSCHLDESSMNHTLAQNSHCEFWCGMQQTFKKHSS